VSVAKFGTRKLKKQEWTSCWQAARSQLQALRW